MDSKTKFISGAVNSDGEVALILDRPLFKRPLLGADAVLVGTERFRPDPAVMAALSKVAKFLFVVTEGGDVVQEFEIAIRRTARGAM